MTGVKQLSAWFAFTALATLASMPRSAHPAWGIVVARSGEVYFSDLETVWRIDTHGRLSVARPGSSGRHVHELAIDDQGNVYGSDYEFISEAAGFRIAIWRMDPRWLRTAISTFSSSVSIRRAPGSNHAFGSFLHTVRSRPPRS